ncbi:MAG TPA: metallophosphoesterase, partial [Brevibacillus sp.]|nr:metallophosphoesterase [Brevibacillus sp.]
MTWIVLFVAVAVVYLRANRNTYDVHTRHVTVPLSSSDCLPNPDDYEPLSILHLSDLHMENLSIDAEQIVDDFSEKKLDLIAITG